MKVSYLWLKEFVDFDASPRQLADDLSMVGIVVETLEAAGADHILDLDVTTNRPDCLSHFGVAREVAARYQKPLKAVATALKESAVLAGSEVSVSIEAPQLCSRYCARVIRNVRVSPSPTWLTQRLESLGVRSINNVVDATNYVLLELGHPLHAFDLCRVQGRSIVVREAREQEKLVTLDGEARELKAGMLVIADRDRALAVAGVMGGADSEIGFSSTDVLLESAWFEPIPIRRTAKALSMHTEASHRFERGADVNAAAFAIDRTAALVQELAGGEILQGIVDAYPRPVIRPRIALRRSRILQVMGTEIDSRFIERVLGALDFDVFSRNASGWQIQLPTSRLDVEREIDLIEEIARHYGYDKIDSTLPAWTGGSRRPPNSIKEGMLKRSLLGLGYSETLTYAFVAAAENQKFSSLDPVRLKNPLSLETEVMRTSLAPGLIASFLHNYQRGTKSVRLYELGRLYPCPARERVDLSTLARPESEPAVLAMIASGNIEEKTVHNDKPRSTGFFDLKGDLVVLLESLSLPLDSILWRAQRSGGQIPDYYHPAVSAELSLGGESLGVCGQLHPRVCDAYKIKQPVFLAEIPLEAWYRYERPDRMVRELAKFPTVQRDLSLVLDKDIDCQTIESTVLQAGIREVQRCFPFDLYFGEKLPSNKKGISISIVYQSQDRTLVDEEVNQFHEKILKLLESKLGAQLRT
ncbi:MAG: phenylalanine--tRNA ligase subunit beta [Acidobacteria bacterium]|nr:phenylalanine--tRNA ligase subunit beta [Acidobacteriota bacterium]MCI0718746.1 phenylalanine--tRNA ligase subunit beta [Acidobacteriota bacterium]